MRSNRQIDRIWIEPQPVNLFQYKQENFRAEADKIAAISTIAGESEANISGSAHFQWMQQWYRVAVVNFSIRSKLEAQSKQVVKLSMSHKIRTRDNYRHLLGYSLKIAIDS